MSISPAKANRICASGGATGPENVGSGPLMRASGD
jgi:hypothetical protein